MGALPSRSSMAFPQCWSLHFTRHTYALHAHAFSPLDQTRRALFAQCALWSTRDTLTRTSLDMQSSKRAGPCEQTAKGRRGCGNGEKFGGQ